MGTLLKSQLLNKNSFDSTQVGPLAYLVHKMSGQGDYTVKVTDRGNLKMQFAISCAPGHTLSSVNVDLSNPASVPAPVLLNSENGYVLFYHSSDFVNWNIGITKNAGAGAPEFDSQKPGEGDLMALNIIKPGKYAMKSASQTVAIEVLHPDKIRPEQPAAVPGNRFSHKDFKLRQTKLLRPNQGMVFEFSKEAGAFTIDLTEESPAKTPFDERMRVEFKTRMLERRPTAAAPKRKYRRTF
jgi:hypothetical protein